ncbi:MAG: hypothetical protein HYT42_01290 [Candidatus Sungbacteria bacterium]|nr:hypothetical protein [Candidatus Sungbacteria bacterium]
MKKLTLPTHPREIAAKALRALPSPRLREVLERRFGLKSRDPETLEAIGRSFGVTRERIRQIEADAVKHIAGPIISEILRPVFSSLEEHFSNHGHVFEESRLLNSVAEPRFHNHVYFLLTVGNPFGYKEEDDRWHTRWFTKKDALESAETILSHTAGELADGAKPVPASELFRMLKNKTREAVGSAFGPDTLESYLGISKLIKQNPYGEFGLVSWPTIRPRGIKDRAFAVLDRAAKPMHFREVAAAISKSGWSSKKAHPQTVHNELIKDPRFVLVGRGLYALSDWGFEPGRVSDVIASVLKSSKKPLSKEAIVESVLKSRFVKPNTVLLNLQNKSLFKKVAEGYTLV